MKTISQLCVVALVGLLIGLHPASSSAQMGNADVRFIPDKCYFVLQFDMQKLYTYEKMGSKSLQNISGFFKKQTQMDLMDMKTFTLQFCEGENPTEFGEDTFGLAMSFGKAVDKESFLRGMEIEFEEGEIDGIKYHKSSNQYAPSVCFPDDKTIVLGMSTALERMIGKKSGNSKISALLKSADPNAEVKGAFHNNEMYKTFLSAIAMEIPVSPFNIEKVFGSAQTAVISGNVKSSTPILFQVECDSEDGAETLAKKVKFLVDMGKATIPITRETMEKQKKEMAGRDLGGFEKFQAKQIDMALNGMDISEKILEAAETSNKGKTTYFKVKKMGGVPELIPVIASMFEAQFEAIDALQEGLDIPLEDDFE